MKYLLHAPEADMTRWKAAAAAAGIPFAEWLRRAANAAHNPPDAVYAPLDLHPPREKRAAPSRARPPRRDTDGAAPGMCVHRVPLDAYCGRC